MRLAAVKNIEDEVQGGRAGERFMYMLHTQIEVLQEAAVEEQGRILASMRGVVLRHRPRRIQLNG